MKKVLIANRGEIARRVIRTLKKKNIKASLYIQMQIKSASCLGGRPSVLVGESPSSESYLRQDRIIEICKSEKIDGVHLVTTFYLECRICK